VGNDPEIQHITIVDNGSIYNIAEQLQTLQINNIQVISVPENKGSAFAFSTGLQFLRSQPEVDWILLLDDDLLPLEGTLQNLRMTIQNYQGISAQTMFLCMRRNRNYLQYAAKGYATELFFPLPNHFLGFHLFRFDLRRKKKQAIRKIKNLPDKTQVNIPCAPYGGLMLHVSSIHTNMLPDLSFHTYADDFDFTWRFTENGGSILLLPDAEAEDLETTLVNRSGSGLFSNRFGNMPDRRLFLLMRNTAWFTRRHLVTHAGIWHLNRILYSGYLLLSAILHGGWRSFKIYNFAVRRGMRGVLDHADIPPEPVKITNLQSLWDYVQSTKT